MTEKNVRAKLSFFESFPGKEYAQNALKEAGELFSKADFSMVNLENIFGDKSIGEPISDREKIEKYFDSWCLTRRWLFDRFDDFKYDEVIVDGNPRQAVKYRGPLHCEAHNDVLVNHIEMAYFGRVEEAKKNLPLLQKYFKVDLD